MRVDSLAFHREALDVAQHVIDAIDRSQFELPTPCDEWNVRQLLEHMIGGNRRIAGHPPAVGEHLIGDDLSAAYAASGAQAAATFEAPGALEAPCAVSYGPVPGSVYAGHRFIDVLIHGWDLAVATRQDTRMDPSLVEACFAVIEPQLDQLKASGAFGTDVVVPADADPQTRLLAVLGRKANS